LPQLIEIREDDIFVILVFFWLTVSLFDIAALSTHCISIPACALPGAKRCSLDADNKEDLIVTAIQARNTRRDGRSVPLHSFAG